MNIKTIGREPSCDLTIKHDSASRQHAHAELADDGRVWITDDDSRNGVFLNRNNSWIRVNTVTLCDGDRIRFGDHEVALQQLKTVFGKRADIKLGEQYFPLRHGNLSSESVTTWDDPARSLQKPKRNLISGRIEEDH